jgi:Glycosyl hydrolases family 6
MERRAKIALVVAVAGTALVLTTLTGLAGSSVRARAAYGQQCSSNNSASRDSVNPLGTPGFTGTNPLGGAHLFVENPWLFGGDAANAIARAVGKGHLAQQMGGAPIPWARFKREVNRMHLSRTTSFRVHQLENVGDYAQAHQFSPYTAGGSGSAIYTQVQNYLCRIQRTDPGATAVITTYFVRHNGGCSAGDHPNFRPEVDALKAAVGRFRALIFVEEDGIDTICWRNPAAVSGRAALLKYEIDQLSQLPHALLYVEGGTSDANSARSSAAVLNAADARKIRGFFLNDTHFNWAANEIKFGNQVSRMTGGLHFVVDTRGNGQGPVRNPNPVTQGNEQLCNPPHRGLGPKPGASDGKAYGMYSPHLDGFVWVTTPGESSAPTCPGRTGHWAASGMFDEGIAIDFAVHANDRVGPSPRYPSRPW